MSFLPYGSETLSGWVLATGSSVLAHGAVVALTYGGFVQLVAMPPAPTPRPDYTITLERLDADTLAVTLDDLCEIEMEYIGNDQQGHEFKCGAGPGECPRVLTCPQFRHIPFDGGHFQSIPHGISQVSQVINVRKHGERPFNLIKKREGLDHSRVRGQHNILVKSTLTTIGTILIEIAGTRKSEEKKNQQQIKIAWAA